MKNPTLSILLFAGMCLAQNGLIQSCVYRWSDFAAEKQGAQEIRHILHGPTRWLKMLKADVVEIPAGTSGIVDSVKDTVETLTIIKEGKLDVHLGGKQQTLGPGSIVMVMPGDAFRYENNGTVPVIFYSLDFKSRNAVDMARADSSGGSFTVDFDDLEFKPHDKGGRYDFYRRSTAMFKYAEMHVTRLNPHIQSHEPHTHGAAEIILMISGNTKMQIGDKFYTATGGDLYYLESNVPHGIQNTGDGPCMYFAFQWE